MVLQDVLIKLSHKRSITSNWSVVIFIIFIFITLIKYATMYLYLGWWMDRIVKYKNCQPQKNTCLAFCDSNVIIYTVNSKESKRSKKSCSNKHITALSIKNTRIILRKYIIPYVHAPQLHSPHTDVACYDII